MLSISYHVIIYKDYSEVKVEILEKFFSKWREISMLCTRVFPPCNNMELLVDEHTREKNAKAMPTRFSSDTCVGLRSSVPQFIRNAVLGATLGASYVNRQRNVYCASQLHVLP